MKVFILAEEAALAKGIEELMRLASEICFNEA
jgi:hypothetical protein